MLLFFNRFNLGDSYFLKGFIDYHSHLLPGVDDGVQNTEESLRILNNLERHGVREVWLTPHIMDDIPNTTEHLHKRFEELKAVYRGKILLHLAAEYMLDNLFKERLEAKDLLPLGIKADHLLVETSYYNPPVALHDILGKIKSAGFHPVLAHPERYGYMGEPDYRKLKEMGIKFQLNLFSIIGGYGRVAEKKAIQLLDLGMYELYGTDVHTPSTLDKMLILKKPRKIETKLLNNKRIIII